MLKDLLEIAPHSLAIQAQQFAYAGTGPRGRHDHHPTRAVSKCTMAPALQLTNIDPVTKPKSSSRGVKSRAGRHGLLL
jgi:hypothetical protein